MNRETRREHFARLFQIALAKRKTKETLRRACHAARQKAEHRHHARHDIVNPIILRAKLGEHHAHGVQTHQHDENLPEVQHQRVLGDPLYAALVCGRGLFRGRGAVRPVLVYVVVHGICFMCFLWKGIFFSLRKASSPPRATHRFTVSGTLSARCLKVSPWKR